MATRDDRTIHLTFAGNLLGVANRHTAGRLSDAIGQLPDRLVVDLDQVTAIDSITISVLMAGYVAAADAGIRYQVVNARTGVLRRLQAAGVARVLADSDDIAALMAAATHPPHAPHTPMSDTRPGCHADRRSDRQPSGANGRPRWHRLARRPAPHRPGVALLCRFDDRSR